MCDSHKNDNDNKNKNKKGDEDMAVIEDVKINVKQSINNSLDEVEQIRKGTLPKRSYKEMIARVREKLSEESK